MSSTATPDGESLTPSGPIGRKYLLRGERAAETIGRDTVDIGDIAVVQDEGDLIAPPNAVRSA